MVVNFYLSIGYRTTNQDVELVMCLLSDSLCKKLLIQNIVNSPRFGQAELRFRYRMSQNVCILLI